MNGDLTPPNDRDAERGALGGMLLSRHAIADVTAIVRGADFYQPIHETIYDAVTTLHGRGEPADAVTVAAELQARGDLNRIGGRAYLHDLISAVPTAANAGYYATVVRDRAVMRRLVEAGTRITQLGYTPDVDDADALLTAAQGHLDAVPAEDTGSLRWFADALADAIDLWRTPDTNVIPTGWHEVDDHFNGGLRGDRLTVVGARPAVGKSTIATVLVRAVAETGHTALFSALEMSEADVVGRIVSAATRVQSTAFVRRDLTSDQWERVEKMARRHADMPIVIDDRPHQTVAQIAARAREVARQPRGLALVVVDYLQLVEGAARKGGGSREEDIAGVSRDLKLMAKSLHVPVVALAQVNRQSTQRTDPRPQMSDLRGSGDIETSADEIILLHQDEETPGEIELNVVKNRHGRTGRITLEWWGSVMDIRNPMGAGS